jgi:hypothetical protein
MPRGRARRPTVRVLAQPAGAPLPRQLARRFRAKLAPPGTSGTASRRASLFRESAGLRGESKECLTILPSRAKTRTEPDGRGLTRTEQPYSARWGSGVGRTSEAGGGHEPFRGFRAHLISSAETVSAPARVMILFNTILLICWVTGRTLPSQKPKLTMLGCLLIQ